MSPLFLPFYGLLVGLSGHFNYKDTCTKSLIFLEAKRLGKLPPNRVSWGGDSAFDNGKLASVDLVEGYHDAEDNVKYGLPLAFTTTRLSWGTLFYYKELGTTGELENTQVATKWSTDYQLKASYKSHRLYIPVREPVADHKCWIRPVDMQTPRVVLMIEES